MANFFTKLFKSDGAKGLSDYVRSVYSYIGNSVILLENKSNTYVEKGYQSNPTIYSIIRLITKTCARAPLMVYEIKDEKAFKYYNAALTSNDVKNIDLASLKKKALEEVEVSTINTIINNPNAEQSFTEFLENVIGFKLITGNTYIWGMSPNGGPNKGIPIELYVLPAHLTQIMSGGMNEPIQGYKVLYNGMGYIPKTDVMHIKYWSPDFTFPGSHFYGQSPLRAGLSVLQQSNEAYLANLKSYQNSGAIGVLYADNNEWNNLSQEQAEKLKNKYIQEYSGAKNRGKVIVSGSKLGWQQIGLSPVDMDVINGMNISMRDLCNIYGVPSQLLNDPMNKTYNNIKEANKSLVVSAVIPELLSFRDAFNKFVTDKISKREGKKYFCDFDLLVYSELADDIEKQVAALEKAYWLTPNEKRAAMMYGEDMEKEEMNTYFMPAGLISIEDAAMNEREQTNIAGEINPFNR